MILRTKEFSINNLLLLQVLCLLFKIRALIRATMRPMGTTSLYVSRITKSGFLYHSEYRAILLACSSNCDAVAPLSAARFMVHSVNLSMKSGTKKIVFDQPDNNIHGGSHQGDIQANLESFSKADEAAVVFITVIFHAYKK